MVAACLLGLVLLAIGYRDLGLWTTLITALFSAGLLVGGFFAGDGWLWLVAIQAAIDIGLVIAIFGEDLAIGGR